MSRLAYVAVLCLVVCSSSFGISLQQIGTSEKFRDTLKDNLLTTDSVALIFIEGNIVDKTILDDKDAFQITPINGGGSFSGPIFRVDIATKYLRVEPYRSSTAPSQSFIIKNIKRTGMSQKIATEESQPITQDPEEELKKLDRIRHSQLMMLISTDMNPYLPDLKIDLKSFFYLDTSGQKQYVSILPFASGSNLYIWAYNWGKQGSNPKIAAHVMRRVGRVIGEVHYQMASPDIKQKMQHGTLNLDEFKTVIHGDFHWSNIFYDTNTGKVTLIDNASLADSLNDPQPYWYDLYAYYMYPKYGTYLGATETLNWLNPFFEAFIQGYVQAFPASMREIFVSDITDIFKALSQIVYRYTRSPPYQWIHEAHYLYDARNFVYEKLVNVENAIKEPEKFLEKEKEIVTALKNIATDSWPSLYKRIQERL